MTTKVTHTTQYKERLARKKELFLSLLTKHNGLILPACEVAHIERKQVYTWRQEDKEFDKAVQDIRFVHLENAEMQLTKASAKGKGWANMFILSHRHPEYAPKLKSEISVVSGEDLV